MFAQPPQISGLAMAKMRIEQGLRIMALQTAVAGQLHGIVFSRVQGLKREAEYSGGK